MRQHSVEDTFATSESHGITKPDPYCIITNTTRASDKPGDRLLREHRNGLLQSQSARLFATGASRDTDEGKLDYDAFLSPLVLKRYAQHMHDKRAVPGQSMLREGDNWQKGIPLSVYMKSLWRHFVSVWESHRKVPGADDIETELCALIFNASGYLHEVLKAKQLVRTAS